MPDLLAIADVTVAVVKKGIKNVHLTVHPPEGRVRLTAPKRMPLDVLRLYAISKLPWIRRQQQAIRSQERETTREYLDRESHYVWGRRYLLRIMVRGAPPTVELGKRELFLHVRPGADEYRCHELLSSWYRQQVRSAVAPLVTKWNSALGVKVKGVFVRQMKTKWGSCNPASATIRLNTELAKKPRECLEYVTVHEMVHLLAPTHNPRFVALMDQSLPGWTHRREMLNRLPVRHEEWSY
jgi:hypothetical protein